MALRGKVAKCQIRTWGIRRRCLRATSILLSLECRNSGLKIDRICVSSGRRVHLATVARQSAGRRCWRRCADRCADGSIRQLDQSERDDVPLRPTNTLADVSAYSRLTANSPFAGHPTLGSCHVWLTTGAMPKGDEVVQECEIGLVRVRRGPGRLSFPHQKSAAPGRWSPTSWLRPSKVCGWLLTRSSRRA